MRWRIASAVLLATLCIGLPVAQNADWLSMAIATGLAALWIGVPSHGYDWTASIGLAGLTLLAAVATVRYAAILWVLPGTIAALAAWDLSHLAQRLTLEGEVRSRAQFLRAHFWTLGLTLAAAWLLAMVATRIQIQLTFFGAFAIITFLVLSLGQIVRMARRTDR